MRGIICSDEPADGSLFKSLSSESAPEIAEPSPAALPPSSLPAMAKYDEGPLAALHSWWLVAPPIREIKYKTSGLW